MIIKMKTLCIVIVCGILSGICYLFLADIIWQQMDLATLHFQRYYQVENHYVMNQTSQMGSNQVLCNEECQWIKEQAHRKATLRHYCDTTNNTHRNWTEWLRNNPNRLNQILVSDEHKLIMCYIPKVACTNWKYVFAVLNGHGDSLLGKDPGKGGLFRQLHLQDSSLTVPLQRRKLTQAEVIYRLENYTSFLMVRDPFTRFLSAYKDKFEDNGPFVKGYRNTIMSAKKNNDGGTHSKKSVSWTEFVRYLGDAEKYFDVTNAVDAHWVRMVDLCFPCQKEYDMIGKLESFGTDSKFMLQGLVDVALLPGSHQIHRDKPATNSSASETSQKYFSSLSGEDIDDLAKKYTDDFLAFGYDATEFKS